MKGLCLGKLLFEGLTRLDGEGKPALAGAEDVEVSTDGKKYLFTLRKNHWSDGRPVTAEDYVRTWRYALSPQSVCLLPHLFYILKNGGAAKRGERSVEEIGVRAIDASTLEVELEHPSPYFFHLLAHPIFVPLHSPEREPTLFNGPFVVREWKKSDSMQLAPNPWFWNKEKVSLPSIHILCVQDPTTSSLLFEKEEIQWVGDPISRLTRDIALSVVARGEALSVPVDRFSLLYLNTKHPLLRSQKIRKALSLSIDRQQIAEHLSFGVPISRFTSSEQNESGLDLEAARTLYREGLEELRFTPQTAPPLVFSYVPVQKTLVEYLQAEWTRHLGIAIRLEASEWNIFRHSLESRNFAMGGCTESVLYKDLLEFFERFEEIDNVNNFSAWDCEEFRRMVASCREEPDMQKREQLIRAAEDLLLEQMPCIPLLKPLHICMHTPELRGYVFDGCGSVDFAYATLR
jgi:oligopeptide transport system substrate-binding protein